jgi:hypothetical protein
MAPAKYLLHCDHLPVDFTLPFLEGRGVLLPYGLFLGRIAQNLSNAVCLGKFVAKKEAKFKKFCLKFA